MREKRKEALELPTAIIPTKKKRPVHVLQGHGTKISKVKMENLLKCNIRRLNGVYFALIISLPRL